MLTITLARNVEQYTPERGAVRFRAEETTWLIGTIEYPGKPRSHGGVAERWALWESDDIDWAVIFGAEDVAVLTVPDSAGWRTFFAEHPPPFPVAYRPPRPDDREPNGSWSLEPTPPEFQLGDVICLEQLDHRGPYPPTWEGEVIEHICYRRHNGFDYSYRLRLAWGEAVVSQEHAAYYGARLVLVRAAEGSVARKEPT